MTFWASELANGMLNHWFLRYEARSFGPVGGQRLEVLGPVKTR